MRTLLWLGLAGVACACGARTVEPEVGEQGDLPNVPAAPPGAPTEATPPTLLAAPAQATPPAAAGAPVDAPPGAPPVSVGQAGGGGSDEDPDPAEPGEDAPFEPGDDAPPAGACRAVPPALLHDEEVGSGAFSGCPMRSCRGVDIAALEARGPLDALVTDLSGFAGCTVIEGDVVVNAHPRPDLRELGCLERVTGTLLIWNSPALRGLSGLEALVEVGGSFEVGMHSNLSIANAGLVDLDAVESLRAVAGGFVVSGGQALQRFGAFPELAVVGGDVFIEFLYGASDIDGLNALAMVGGSFNLWRPEGLQRVSGLQALDTIGGYFLLWGATDLAELSGLPRLACIGGRIDIGGSAPWENNPRLRAIRVFPALRTVGADVVVEDNPQLERFDMLSTVEVVGDIIVLANNPALTAFPLDALQSVWMLDIHDNPRLSECPLLEVADRAMPPSVEPRLERNLSCP